MGGNSGAVLTKESVIFLHTHRRAASAAGIAVVQDRNVTESGVDLYYRNLYTGHLFCGLYHREEAEKQKVPVGGDDGIDVLSGVGRNLPDREPPAGHIDQFFSDYSGAVQRGRYAGRYDQLKKL